MGHGKLLQDVGLWCLIPINTFSKELKAKAIPIIAQSPDAFKGIPTDEVPSVIYGLLKNKGIKLDEIADSKNIVESTSIRNFLLFSCRKSVSQQKGKISWLMKLIFTSNNIIKIT